MCIVRGFGEQETLQTARCFSLMEQSNLCDDQIANFEDFKSNCF